MNKQEIIQSFNPNDPGSTDGNLFGLPFTAEQSEIIIVPAPWEVTVSYGSGASKGIQAIFDASFQVDLANVEFPDLWKLGIFLDDEIPNWEELNLIHKQKAKQIIQAYENGLELSSNKELQEILVEVNQGAENFNQQIEQRTTYWLNQGKLVGFLGGDHSTPLGYYKALSERHASFGILHLDAHMDLRKAYEGFTYSHASIMQNALQVKQIEKIVQVGIRDFCQEEIDCAQSQPHRLKIFTDNFLKTNHFEGKTWQDQCVEIIKNLPQKVYISLDIDVLQAWYCPHTGTPVPGGLSFEQTTYLLSQLANSGKQIIGFDLVEVAPGDDDWDGNVGARMLFHLCGSIAKSHNLATGEKIEFF